MGKASLAFTTVLLWVSLSGTVCAKEKKSDQMTALDNAFKAGVLTKEEYEAKKAALEKASAPGPAGTGQANAEPGKPQNSPSAGAAAGGARGSYYRLKKVQVIDQYGFERPMPALSLLIPTDWQFQGGIQYLQGGCGLAQTTFRASGPDGRSIELLPEYNWQWSDDGFTVQSLRTQRGCDVMRPMAAGDFLRRIVVPKVRPGARVVGVEPIPQAAKQMQEIARQAETMSAQAGLRINVRSDVARARLQYTHDGRAVEGWVTAVMLVKAWPWPTYDVQTMRQGQALYYSSWARMFDLRAPPGQLDASEKFFQMVISTMRVEPEWESRVAAVQNNIAAAQIKGAADRSKIISKSNAEISNIIIKGHEERSKAHDRSMANYSQALRGVESYRNPNTGETFELSNQYGHAWVNNNNEYILSDQEGFDPNVSLKSGNWTALQRVKP